MPTPGNVWAADTWTADSWAADTWADASAPVAGTSLRPLRRGRGTVAAILSVLLLMVLV